MNSLSNPFEDVLITTVDDGPFFIDDLFQRKFAHPAPYHGNSVVCFYRKNWQHFIPVCYVNFMQYEEVMLGGGAVTDAFAFRNMPKSLIRDVKTRGGIYLHILKFSFHYFRNECEGYFGYTADKLALEVDLKAGFEPTKYEHLIAHFHKPLTPERQDFLIDKVHAVGSF